MRQDVSRKEGSESSSQLTKSSSTCFLELGMLKVKCGESRSQGQKERVKSPSLPSLPQRETSERGLTFTVLLESKDNGHTTLVPG